MNQANLLLPRLSSLSLQKIGDAPEAGLYITSLPWPRAAAVPVSLAGQSTYVKALGQWPGDPKETPRRLLLISDATGEAPSHISPKLASPPATTKTHGWQAEMQLFERSPHKEYVWERHFLKLTYGGKEFRMLMGMRTAGEFHWWEACSLVIVEETPQCLTIEMGGTIPHVHMTLEDLKSNPGYTNPFLHKHNWLHGKISARLHSNGVCEIFANHINNKFFDDGLELADCIPVVGFPLNDGEVCPQDGVWDGSQTSLTIGDARLDVEEVARLATPQQPGSLERAGDFLVWQPYQGMELYGGIQPRQLTGDPYHLHAEQHVVPRGMSRTLRFSASLSDRSPKVVRYLAPAWWYGACEEFVAEPLLPVSDGYDDVTAAAAKWVKDHIVRLGFEDGSVPRGSGERTPEEPDARCEPGWEGDIPYTQFLRAWRTGDTDDYELAMRSAYHFTDVIVDHAAKAVRMHGYPPHAFAVPMNRMLGTIGAYLETGDPNLLRTAQAVLANSHWTHLNSWPRLAIGRDACFIRGAVLLYRYFADEFFRAQAEEACLTVAHSQRPNGSFGDQGGGTGIHQWAAYITKPWMGLLALGPVLDYLELFPDTPALRDCVLRFADWLMAERHDHDGIMGWSYQHEFDGGRQHFCPFNNKMVELPSARQWHHDSFGRVLLYATLETKDPAYFWAWAESRKFPLEFGDHSTSASLQFIPWIQAKIWGARLTASGIQLNPPLKGALLSTPARVLGPEGRTPVVPGAAPMATRANGATVPVAM